LLLWPFVLLADVSDEYVSEWEVFSDAPWFVAGIMCLIVPFLSILFRNSWIMEDVSIPVVFLTSLVLYFFFGVWCFLSERVTNAPIPWQHNGRW
jgi:hypothetical protein